jgi:hypothetical protein
VDFIVADPDLAARNNKQDGTRNHDNDGYHSVAPHRLIHSESPTVF